MSSFKRIAIVLAAAAAVFVVAGSFKSSNVKDRAIILGLGVDIAEEGGVRLTAEVVSPGNGTEQVGTFSKIVTVNGQTINVALQNVAQVTGKEASLGQCVVLVLGQNYCENVDFSDLTEYFIHHHSFKESAVICCCRGSAEELFNCGDGLSQSMSLSIASALLDQAEKIAVPTNSLMEFVRSQNELFCTGYLNRVSFVPSQNTDAQLPDKPLGYVAYRELSVFRQNKFVDNLGEEDVKGFSLFLPQVYGETFVSFADAVTRTVQVTQKSVSLSPKNGGFEAEISLSVRFGRTDSEQVSGALSAKNDKEIPQKVLDDVARQAQNIAQKFLETQSALNFDLLNFHEIYRRKQGTNALLAQKPMEQFPVTLRLTVSEE